MGTKKKAVLANPSTHTVDLGEFDVILMKNGGDIRSLSTDAFTLGKGAGTTGAYLVIGYDDEVKLFRRDLSGFVNLSSALVTDERVIFFPDKGGTYAMLDDLNGLIGSAYFIDDPFTPVSKVSGCVASFSHDGTGAYTVTFVEDFFADAEYGFQISAHVIDTNMIVILNHAPEANVLGFATKKFNPGVLGVALPSWDLFDASRITVSIYKLA